MHTRIMHEERKLGFGHSGSPRDSNPTYDGSCTIATTVCINTNYSVQNKII